MLMLKYEEKTHIEFDLTGIWLKFVKQCNFFLL